MAENDLFLKFKMMNINQIMDIIPHRYPFLLIDKVTELELMRYACGIKNVTINEPHFCGHFADMPVMPGVLMVEAIAQLSAILVARTIGASKETKIAYLTSINNAKFRKIVSPGDTVVIRTTITQHKGVIWKFVGTCTVENSLCVEAEISAAVKDKR